MEFIKTGLKEMVDAFTEFENAKEDMKIRVDAAYDTMLEKSQMVKAHDIDKKVFTKIAKSIVANKIGDLNEENELTSMILEQALGVVSPDLGGGNE
ncbi:MAG: hypothetical protein WC055_00670 [Melioribacteraceae bacterium]